MLEQIDEHILRLAIAIGIGFLVGLQREWVTGKRVGLRSFVLIATLGGVCGLLVPELGPWLPAAALVALAFGLFLHAKSIEDAVGPHGMTTEIAALVVFVLGTSVVLGYVTEGVVLGGFITILLHWKQPLQSLVRKIGANDFAAIARFLVVALVVLPVLPNQAYGYFSVLNPYQIWLMVVLVVAINLAGYIVLRIIGSRSGATVAGALGGLISSTATTVSYAGKTKENANLDAVAAIVICVASTMVYGRILLEISIVAPGLLAYTLWPLVSFTVFMIIAVTVLVTRVPAEQVETPETDNPAQLKVAFTFAALYAAVIFAVAAVKELLGDQWIFLVSALSGLTDVDALTLSVSQLFQAGSLDGVTGGRAIFVASLSNLIFKWGVVLTLGNRRLKTWISAAFGSAIVVGLIILVTWPGTAG
jgi:uncharacterized membrane protein (DUF4010 family)